jgi:hypothetical protein
MGRSRQSDRIQQLTGLFLYRQLLFNFAPCTDLQTTADPAKRLGPDTGGLIPANGTLRRFFQTIGRNRPFRLFQNGGGNHRLRLRLWLTSHKTPQSDLTMADAAIRDNSGKLPQSTVDKYVPGYAASGICTTTATSSEDMQRGHRWPATTRGNLPRKSISAGTVWVQIGQWACPFV